MNVQQPVERSTGVRSSVLGYPRIGPDRELKRAVERYWAGDLDAGQLAAVGADLRAATWTELATAGLDEVPAGTFSYYDHMLDAAAMLGVAPGLPRDGAGAGDEWFSAYFALARGSERMPAWEMTKWFDTNYHFIVAEIGPHTPFMACGELLFQQCREAAALGVTARPVLVGPITFLLLAKSDLVGFRPLDRLDDLLEAYESLLAGLAAAGAEWVQLDEPALVGDLTADELAAAGHAYRRLGAATARPRILVATYFGEPYLGAAGDALQTLLDTGIDGLALDLVAGPGGARRLTELGGLGSRVLHAGVVDGRNVWRTDLAAALATCAGLLGSAGELVVSTSCSLLHVPVDVRRETDLDSEIAGWLAFARQKVDEVVAIGTALREGAAAGTAAADAFEHAAAMAVSRAASPRITDAAVQRRLAALSPTDLRRATPAGERAVLQRARLRLPLLPTTTIGSFPQTTDVRRARQQVRGGAITAEEYTARMHAEIDRVIAVQEDIGLDVLVHGEPERNDMVQFFAEQLAGYAATTHGWVQSYGTRCVRPPILYGDVSRPAPMTVAWARHAQSRTARPVKGMLTGPVTMLKWSFVRDDQPPAQTARQVALVLRDEVADLEAAGITIIQVDEPAFREGLPLRAAHHRHYLDWAVAAFRLATAGVDDRTQIHTHMCYSEFSNVITAIADLDADVTSVEAARSRMEIVADLIKAGFTAGIGPGVYDIHSPRVPTTADVEQLIRRALTGVDATRLWINPDCGLKTRTYEQIEPALRAMVGAAGLLRGELVRHRPETETGTGAGRSEAEWAATLFSTAETTG